MDKWWFDIDIEISGLSSNVWVAFYNLIWVMVVFFRLLGGINKKILGWGLEVGKKFILYLEKN